MTELRENARYIFWSGALAFHGPKIIFLHNKNKEFLVERALVFYVHSYTPDVMVVICISQAVCHFFVNI